MLTLTSEFCGFAARYRNALDYNLKQSELQHIGFVCCNLRCGKLVVDADNILVVVS